MESTKALSEFIEEIDKLLCILNVRKIRDRARDLNAKGFSHKQITELSRMVTNTYNSEPNFNTYAAPKGTIGLQSTRKSVFECKVNLVAKSLKDLGLLETYR
jgi:hypothetical protein